MKSGDKLFAAIILVFAMALAAAAQASAATL